VPKEAKHHRRRLFVVGRFGRITNTRTGSLSRDDRFRAGDDPPADEGKRYAARKDQSAHQRLESRSELFVAGQDNSSQSVRTTVEHAKRPVYKSFHFSSQKRLA
jgi:hypothetical protein